MSRVLVTGSCGFLGQYLLPHLASAGHDVLGVDLRSSVAPQFTTSDVSIEYQIGVDICHQDRMEALCKHVDAVIHLAGLVSFWRKDARRLYDINVGGTESVLRAAMKAGCVNTFVHVSSVAAVGFGANSEKVDEEFSFNWDKYLNKHYMHSKRQAEDAISALVSDNPQSPIRAVIASPGLMWGPGDLLNSRKLICAMRGRTIFTSPPGGTNVVDVRDIAAFLPKLLLQGYQLGRYILGGDNLSFLEISRAIAGSLNQQTRILILPQLLRLPLYAALACFELCTTSAPNLTSDNVDSAFRNRFFSSEKAIRELGWNRRYTFAQTIEDSVAWLRQHGHL